MATAEMSSSRPSDDLEAPASARDENGNVHGSSSKRKTSSSEAEQDPSDRTSKRSKVDDVQLDYEGNKQQSMGSPPPSAPNNDKPRAARSDSLQEEKKRGRRLFGGLLSTLSQTTASTQQKKRQEIERRQLERAHQQRAEDDRLHSKKLAKLKELRKAEQIRFDEQVMKTRHLDILAKARFLHTRNNPKVYYRPWDLTEGQDDIIKTQIRNAEDLVERELSDFKHRKDQHMKAHGIPVDRPASLADSKETVEKADEEEQHATSHPPHHAPSTSSALVDESKNTVQGGHHEREIDEAETGDVMVEEEEDTVIY